MNATEHARLLRAIKHIETTPDYEALVRFPAAMQAYGFAWRIEGSYQSKTIEASFTKQGEISSVAIDPADMRGAVCKAAKLALARERIEV